MYRYDEFDAEFVRQRVAQFRDQVGRRLSGELTEDEFKPLRLMNGLYLQLHAYMLRIAIPYGTLSSRQMRKLAHIARTYDRGYGHFTTRQNLQFNWPKLKRHPRHPGRAGRGRDARHPDLGQLHPQRHRRPLRRRHRRRGGRPAPLCRDHPPVVVAAPRVQLPAAQVQDRGDRRAEHDRAAIQVHDIGLHAEARSPTAGSALRSTSAAARAARRCIAKMIRDDLPEERPAQLSRGHPARLQSARPARQQVQGAHQDPGARDRRRGLHARRSRRSGSASATARSSCPRPRSRRIEAYFAPPAFERRPAEGVALRDAPIRAFDRWVTRNTHAHKQPGYAIVTISLKPIGGIPGDATRRADGRGRRPRRALLLRRGARHARAEPGAAARAHRRPAAVYAALDGASAWPRPTPGWSPTSSPARASTTARSPTPARSRSRSASPSGSAAAPGRDRRAQDQDLRLHQRLRPPPRRPHRHPRRREARRGALPAPARRLRRRGRGARRHHRPRLRPRRHRRCGREGGRHLSRSCAPSADEPFLAAYGRLGAAPFKEALYAAAA